MSPTDAVALFGAALQVSMPTFGWVLFGMALYRGGLLPERWIHLVSRFAFNVSLPLMLVCIGGSIRLGDLCSTGRDRWPGNVRRGAHHFSIRNGAAG